MAGPQESRLIQALNGAEPARVDWGADQWALSAGLLRTVSEHLASASMPIPDGDAGARTAQAMNDAFKRSANAMSKRAEKLQQGQVALKNAVKVIEDAKAAHTSLGAEGSAPTYTPHEDPGSEAGIKAHNDYLGKMAAFQAEQERRERISREQADRMDHVFESSAKTMKEIHGEPDPVSPSARGGGGGGSAGGGGYSPQRRGGVPPYSPDGGRPSQPTPYHAPTPEGGPGPYAPGPGGGGPGYVPGPGGSAQSGTTVDYPSVPGSTGGAPAAPIGSTSGGGMTGTAGLGVAGAAAGGIGGGLLGTGLASGGIRGGFTPVVTNPGTSASGVRGIGATARSGVSGTLGRAGSGVGAVSSGTGSRGTAARPGGVAAGRGASAGRGAGGRGSSTGARGAAGGRGGAAGSTAGGRIGRSKDEKGRRRDLFDAGEDWIDDEDAAPGILD